MKKWILVLLLITFIFILCPAAQADEGFQLQSGQKDALREAGREYEDLLAMGSDEDVAAILARSGDTAQWTVLERNGEDTWRVAVTNDTIPLSFISSASLSLWDNAQDKGEEIRYLKLEIEKDNPSVLYRGQPMMQAYRTIEFMRNGQGDWLLCSACDVPFEENAEGYCPYHLLRLTQDGWLYKFYEEIMNEDGWAIDRSEEIQRKTVSMEEMTPYTELSAFDYPAFLSFLHTLAPMEYEHAPVATMAPLPTVTPANPPAGDAPEFVYYNTNGGKYYHADACCPCVDPTYWPLTPVSFEKINNDKGYSRLLPCSVCGAPERTNTDAGESK